MATIKGKWRWNDNIRDPWYDHDEKNATISFKSGEKSFSSITVAASFLNHAIIHYDEIEVQSCEIIWEEGEADCIDTFDENYRLMDFGESYQEIDDELYDFIIANAHEWNISDKLKIIAENEQKVYDAGVDAGKQAEYDAFWDAKQPRKGERHMMNGNYGGNWTIETFRPKYDIVPQAGVYLFFGNNLKIDLVEHLKSIGRKLDFSQCDNQNGAFYMSNFTHIGKVSALGGYYYVFQDCKNLVTIDEWGDAQGREMTGNGMTTTFSGCTALENITIKGYFANDMSFKDCTKLSRDSITNIINHLSDIVGKKLTLSRNAVDIAFEFRTSYTDSETGEEISLVIKGTDEDNPYWWDLADTKPNWTIELV